MSKLAAVVSPILLAATLSAGIADGQTPTPVKSDTPETQRVTIAGCVVRNGSVDIDKGTRVLDLPAGALALTDARPVGAPTKSQNEKPDSLTFALVGESAGKLETFIGKRVEIVGRVTRTTHQTPPEAQEIRGTAHPSAEIQQLEIVSFRGISGGCN
jgi:hypothetical protein